MSIRLRLVWIYSLFIVIFFIGCTEKQDEVIPMSELELTSSAFENEADIPDKYTCMGEDINPPLDIRGIPEGTRSLVLIIDDPDAPMGNWDHWIVFNIKPVSKIEENSVPEGAVQGVNDFGRTDYGGPCPPSGTHRYMFKLYALGTTLNLDSSAKKIDVETAMKGHIIAQTKLVGLYTK